MAYPLDAYHLEGKAIFSTHNGKYARREMIPGTPTILRSNPSEDQQTMAAKLQKHFPQVCKAITTPVTDVNLDEYFDYYDAAVQGFEFLRAVLEYIAGLNTSVNAKMAAKVQDYVGRWKNANGEAFTHIRPQHTVMEIFTLEDIKEHGNEFLTDAMMQIKQQRKQEDDEEARQNALRLQTQHAYMMHNQSNFTPPQVPTWSQVPVNPSTAQDKRASFNPEPARLRLQRGPVRHVPVPPGQFPIPQGRFPLQRLHPSKDWDCVHPDLTNFYPGRGDFHSDHTTHNATDADDSDPPKSLVAIPPRGFLGPFSYQSHSPLSRSGPLPKRRRNFDGDLPKGKKNPTKKSSDDARMVSDTGGGLHQGSNGETLQRPVAPFTPQYEQSPEGMPLVSGFRPPPGAVPNSGDYHQPDLLPGHRSGNWQETPHHPPYDGPAPMQLEMEFGSRERAMTNPYLSDLEGPTQDPYPTAPTFPIPTNVQHQVSTANGQLYEENPSVVPTRMRPPPPTPLDSHAFGHQLSDLRVDAQDRQDPVVEGQRHALAPMSNTSQQPSPETPGHSIPWRSAPWRSGANGTPRRLAQEVCTIWISGFPENFDKAAAMDLLGVCRGFLVVGDLRRSPNIDRSYAFADFQNPTDATEALIRLPQTRFASLPEGVFLTVQYPKHRQWQSPGYHWQGSDDNPKWSASQVSPTKLPKEDSTRAGKMKKERGRRPSESSARGKKQSTGSPEERMRRPSEHVIGVDDVPKESGLQTEEAIAVPDPHDKVGSMAHRSRSNRDGQKPKPMSQDSALVQPDIGVETHANQVSSDGVQDISSAPGAKAQAQESHQATSPRHIEGRAEVPKKKSKGSKKLPGSRNKGPEPPMVQPASGSPKPDARGEPSENSSGILLEDSGPLEDRAKQGRSKIEASNVTAPTVPLEPITALSKDPDNADQSFLGRNPMEGDGHPRAPAVSLEHTPTVSKVLEDQPGLDQSPTEVDSQRPAPLGTIFTLSKNPETADQSFLGRKLTEGDGEPPNASVANFTRPSDAKDDIAEVTETAPAPGEPGVSAVPLEQSKEPRSQATRRDVSSSIQGSSNKFQSISSSTAPMSNPWTQRSDSTAQETLPPMDQAGCPAWGVALLPSLFEPGQPRDNLEASIVSSNAFRSGSAVISKRVIEGDGRSRETRSDAAISIPNPEPGETYMEQRLETPTGPIEEDSGQNPTDRLFLRSPVRNRAPSIPPRSSSLASPPTPIKTHQKKKKPRNFTTVKEAPSEDGMDSPSKVQGLTVESTKMDSSVHKTGSTKQNFTVLTVGSAMRILTTDKAKDLPKPETPFVMDNGVRVASPKISRQIVMEASNAEHYYAQKNLYQVDHLGNAMQNHVTFNSLESSKSTTTRSSNTSTPDHTSANKQSDLETTLRQAGFRALLGTSPFTIKDPELALLETLEEEGNLLENRTNKDRPLLSWVDDKGKIGLGMSFDAWTKQHEMIEVVKKATAVKRLLAVSPPPPWTKIESLRQRLSRFVTHCCSDAQEHQTTEEKAQQIQVAKTLLDKIPQRDSSTSEMQKWSRKVSLFLKENASEPSPAYTPTGKFTDNSPSPSKSSRGTPDAFNAELNNIHTSGQSTDSEPSPSTFGRRTPSEERSTPSAALIPSALLSQASKLKDLFVEMGEVHQRVSDDHHQVSTPEGEEHMTSPDPELNPMSGEFDVPKVIEVKDSEPEEGVKRAESQVPQKPLEGKQSESKGKEFGSEAWKRDQSVTVTCDVTQDPASAESKEEAPEESEDPTPQQQISQSFGVSLSSVDSNCGTTNDGDSEEAQRNQPSGLNALQRSGYNVVAGRGTDGKRDGKKDAGKDPWALPQGEKPWGGGEGRGEKKKKKRERH